MNKLVVSMFAAIGLTAACGGSYPQPTERLASSEAAVRSARELGAENDPQAALHVRLADEQIATAKNLMHDKENKRADLVLQRASADAELALMLTRERAAKTELDKAQQGLQQTQSSGLNRQPTPMNTTPSTSTPPVNNPTNGQ